MVQIGRLLFHAPTSQADAGAIALRLRVERLLGTIELTPSGLPTGAILVVRELHGTLPVSGGAAAQSWGPRLRAAMGTLYQQAARPARGPVPSHAPSVLFADPAELLACLTRDALAERVGQQWYWRQLVRGLPTRPVPQLAAMWEKHAAALPAAFALLGGDTSRAAVALLGPPEVSHVVQGLHHAFALPPQVLATQRPPVGAVALGAPPPPPWLPWLADTPASKPLAPQAHYLLGLTATLQHRPTAARSQSFAAQAVAWLAAALAMPPAPPPASPPALTPHLAHPTPPSGSVSFARPPDLPREATPTTRTPSTPIVAALAATPTPTTAAPPAPSLADEARQAGVEERSLPWPAPLTGAVQSELAGVLYLVHLLAWLDLPGAWGEAERGPDALSGWLMVEAVARGLLGDDPRHASDPLWSVLAQLDGREGKEEPPYLPADDTFRLPVRWLHRYGSANPIWYATSRDGRAWLVAAGQTGAPYLVAEVPLLGRSPAEAIAAEIAAYRAAGIEATWEGCEALAWPRPDAGVRAALPPRAARWLEGVLGFVRHLLARALRVEPDEVPDALLRRRGWLVAGRTHVDLYEPMEQISLPARRAGLDCTPGWLPDLGRVVTFHFLGD